MATNKARSGLHSQPDCQRGDDSVLEADGFQVVDLSIQSSDSFKDSGVDTTVSEGQAASTDYYTGFTTSAPTDVPMADASSTNESMPWLDYMENVYGPYGFPQYHSALPGVTDNPPDPVVFDQMSDSDDGGAALAGSYADTNSVIQPNSDTLPLGHEVDDGDDEEEEENSEDGDISVLDNYLPPPEAVTYVNAVPGSFTYAHLNLPLGYEFSTGLMAFQPTNLGIEDPGPLMPTNGNSEILGSENQGLFSFLRSWAHFGRMSPNSSRRSMVPDIHQIHGQVRKTVEEVGYSDLRGDHCDFQGVDWAAMGTNRKAARVRRSECFKNYVNHEGSDRWHKEDQYQLDAWVPSTENYFRFRRMFIRQDVKLTHFQLRSMLACPSRSHIYYGTRHGINRLNPISRKASLAVNLGSEFPPFTRAITTLDANCGALVGGTFAGEFVVKSLYSEDKKKHSEGVITTGITGITNHLQVHTTRRSSSPVVGICSNDHGFRTLDLETEQFTQDLLYHFALNCSAMSPDRRLRVLVGDSPDVTITNAETGETEVELTGHQDYGFACDWSDDGVTVATGFQDKRVKIWDARKWTDSDGNGTPLASIWCDMAGVRNLRFSPLGSGPQVLVAAEEADIINIIDCKTFQKKQTLDVFGEIGGVAFSDEGQELNVLVADPQRGGLLQFDRCPSAGGRRGGGLIEDMKPF